IPARQSSLGAYPKIPIVVLTKGPDGVARQPVSHGKPRELPVLEPDQRGARANPQVELSILKDDLHRRFQKTVAFPEMRPSPIPKTAQANSVIGADPEASLVVFAQREDQVARRSLVFRKSENLSILQKIESASPGADPDTSRTVLQNRHRIVVAQTV